MNAAALVRRRPGPIVIPSTAPIVIPAGALTPSLTLAALAPRFLVYLRLIRRRALLTVEAYGQDLKGFLAFCDRAEISRPDQVRPRVISWYLAWLQEERGLCANSANRHLHTLRSFWQYLLHEEVAVSNPAAAAFQLPTPKRLPKYLTIPEQERVLATLERDDSLLGERDYALVATALFTGLRCAELAHLRLVDITLEADAGVLRLIGKGDKERELPIIPRLAAILRAYLTHTRPALLARPVGGALLPEGPYVFVNANRQNGHRLHRSGQALLTRSLFHVVRNKVSAIVGRTVSPHVLRHSAASRARENNAPLELIGEMLGHASLSTTMIYAHISTAKRKADLTRFLS